MNSILLYGALLLTQCGNCTKQFAMKKCGAIAPGPFNSVCINMMRATICFVISCIIWLIADGGRGTTLEGHLIILAGGIGTAFNLFAWILSTRAVSLILLESISTVTTMIIPMLLAPVLYNGDKASPLQWIGSILIFVSLFFFSEKKDHKKKEKAKGSFFSKFGIVFLCAVSAGLAAISKKFYTENIVSASLGSVEYYTFMSFVIVLVVFAVLFAVFYGKERCAAKHTGGKVELPYKRVWVYILIAASALYVVELFATYAAKLPDGIYYPLSRGLTAGTTFLLDVFAFKDKVTVKKIVGLVLVIVSVVMVNLQF